MVGEEVHVVEVLEDIHERGGEEGGVGREGGQWVESMEKLAHTHMEPHLAIKETQIMSNFTNMINKRARNPAETKVLLMELEERAKRVEEVTKQAPEDRHMMSVLASIIDLETLKYTAQYQGKCQLEKLKIKIKEFVNLVT